MKVSLPTNKYPSKPNPTYCLEARAQGIVKFRKMATIFKSVGKISVLEINMKFQDQQISLEHKLCGAQTSGSAVSQSVTLSSFL